MQDYIYSMEKLVFATHNKHKLAEIQSILKKYSLISLDEIGITEEIPENEMTLAGNALAKARYIKKERGLDCFADDTGLEVEILDGEPGVYSARYAGAQKNSTDNMNLLLEKLSGRSNRKARFKTVIALLAGKKEYLFEGIVEGEITLTKCGTGGFGYDPIFKPNGFDKTFAEMTMDEKNTISHRKRAVQKLVDFLNKD